MLQLSLDCLTEDPADKVGQKLKKCIKCNTWKPLSAFGNAIRQGADNKFPHCKECNTKNNKIRERLRQQYPVDQYKSCMCCHQDKPLVLDHCYETGIFRGYLCQKCNMAIGLLGDNFEGVERAFKYMSKFVDVTNGGRTRTGAMPDAF